MKTQNIAGLFEVNKKKNYQFTEIIKNIVINTKNVTYAIKKKMKKQNKQS